MEDTVEEIDRDNGPVEEHRKKTTSKQFNSIVSSQLASLDDTDCYASTWLEILRCYNNNERKDGEKNRKSFLWGGKGKGGRGLSRRTFQPFDIIVNDVCLEYVARGDSLSLSSKVLLTDSTLKLLSGKVYALVGKNGCGKSTLLKRIDAGTIPGFPPHISTMYIQQEVFVETSSSLRTPIDIVLSYHNAYNAKSIIKNRMRINYLEEQLESLDMSVEENSDIMEKLCEEIGLLEEDSNADDEVTIEVTKRVRELLLSFDILSDMQSMPYEQLSGGQKKKVLLACAAYCVLYKNVNLLLLDEPTNFLDIRGLLQLRQFINTCTSQELKVTILMVSHDIDLINDVTTDIIQFENQSLMYYNNCNYNQYMKIKRQEAATAMRNQLAFDRQKKSIQQTIKNIKKQPTGKRRGDARKKSKAVKNKEKILEKHYSSPPSDVSDTKQQQLLIKKESINDREASLTIDKAVQFVFPDTTCTWDEPLIMAMDVGHGYFNNSIIDNGKEGLIVDRKTKDEMLFDCVDLCINEGSFVCILGDNGSGKSTLIRILTKKEAPLEGTVHHALNVNIGYFDQHIVDDMVDRSQTSHQVNETPITALSLLKTLYPKKSEQDIRGILSDFGLNSKQTTTNIMYLSGGERCRLCLAITMISNPQVLVIDEPTSHLDPESVMSLSDGLKKWNGTVIMVSHDVNFIRSLDNDDGLSCQCYVIMKSECKIRKVPNGIDTYLKSFKL